jgi:hypothetical protein
LLVVCNDQKQKYVPRKVFTFCTETGITHELTQAYTPSHNEILEKKKCKLLEKAHVVVVDAQTPRFLKVDAINTTNYLTN